MTQADMLSINTVAAKLGLSVHQLRRWELMFGLEIKRGRGQQRQYRSEDLSILERIKELVEQGWPTSQIRPQLEAEGLITPKLIGVPQQPGNPEMLMEAIIGLRSFTERRFIEISKQIDELRQLMISITLRNELRNEISSPWQPVEEEFAPPPVSLPPEEISIGPAVNVAMPSNPEYASMAAKPKFVPPPPPKPLAPVVDEFLDEEDDLLDEEDDEFDPDEIDETSEAAEMQAQLLASIGGSENAATAPAVSSAGMPPPPAVTPLSPVAPPAAQPSSPSAIGPSSGKFSPGSATSAPASTASPLSPSASGSTAGSTNAATPLSPPLAASSSAPPAPASPSTSLPAASPASPSTSSLPAASPATAAPSLSSLATNPFSSGAMSSTQSASSALPPVAAVSASTPIAPSSKPAAAPALSAEATKKSIAHSLGEITDQNYLTVLGKALDLIGWSDEQADQYSQKEFGIAHWDELGRSHSEKLISYLVELMNSNA